MRKKIVLIIFMFISIFVTGCGNKSVETKPKSSVESTSNDSTNNGTIASSNDPKIESNYSSYSGSFVKETSLKADYKYGIVVSINVDKDGNLEGVVSDTSENVTHISNVNIKGKIEDGKLISDFTEDGWGHGGSIKLDFKDNKVVLVIKYSPNSSKDNFWGIGEGTFELINSNTKVNRTLDNLKDGGLQIIENQCFSVKFENYGSVKLISGLKREDVNTIVIFYLVDSKNNVLYRFPDFYGNAKGMINNVSAVSFVDANKDGLKDVVVIANYSLAGVSSTIASIYFQEGKTFVNNKVFDDKVNRSLNNKDINTVLKYAKNNLLK